MMRADDFNLHIYSVRLEITGMQQIPISHICYSYKSESKGIIMEEKISQLFSTDKSKSESVIINEISTEESKSESFHKIINTNK